MKMGLMYFAYIMVVEPFLLRVSKLMVLAPPPMVLVSSSLEGSNLELRVLAMKQL